MIFPKEVKIEDIPKIPDKYDGMEEHNCKYFQSTGPSEYGEGFRFLKDYYLEDCRKARERLSEYERWFFQKYVNVMVMK